ncbi:MAG: hypothetical protein ACREVK_00780 [Gammaproteobacteria bacterium]
MARIIDLMLIVRHGMCGVEFEKVHSGNEHGWDSRLLHLYSHSGTGRRGTGNHPWEASSLLLSTLKSPLGGACIVGR